MTIKIVGPHLFPCELWGSLKWRPGFIGLLIIVLFYLALGPELQADELGSIESANKKGFMVLVCGLVTCLQNPWFNTQKMRTNTS